LNFALIDGFVTTFDYGKRGVWMRPLAYFPQPYNRSGVLGSKRPNGTFVVRATIPGSPASAADIKKGDIIVSVNGVAASQFSSADFVAANAAQVRTITFGIWRGTATHSQTVVLHDLLPIRKDNRPER
jgi:S1-C subfamily serine protease